MTTSLPDVFLPYQQRLWQTIDANNLVVIEKSRRTGFSWALAAIAAARAGAARSAGGEDVLYMGYEKDMTREFMDYVAEWARQFQLAASEVQEFVFQDPDRPEKAIGAFRIKFDSGFEVIALPSVPRALRGKQGTVILDEAAFMDDLDEVLKAALALLMWGGRVVVCSTHFGDTNPFNGLITEIRAGRRKAAVMRLTFEEALAEGLYRRICLTRGLTWSAEAEAAWVADDILATYGDSADEELHVIPSPSSGVYLPGPLLEARSEDGIPVLRYTGPDGMAMWAEHLRVAQVNDWLERETLPILEALDRSEPIAMGGDFGRVRDLTVWWFLGIDARMRRPTRLVVELRNVPFDQQKQMLFFILDRIGRLLAAKLDAGGNGAYLAEVAQQRYGGRVEAVMFTENWYREEMPPFKAALEDGMMSLPRDRDIHGDLRNLKLIRGVARIAERTRVNEKASRHGDAAIAAALAYAASRQPPEEYAYESVHDYRPRRDHWRGRADEDDDGRAPVAGMLPVLRDRAWAPR